MLFFKVTVEIDNDEWKKKYDEKEFKHEQVPEINALTETYNNRKAGLAYFFVSKIKNNKIEIGFIMERVVDFAGFFYDVIPFANVDPDLLDLEETTLANIVGMLRVAERAYFIDDAEEVLDKLGLHPLCGYRAGRFSGETLLDIQGKKALYESATKYMAKETLIPELDRIFTGEKYRRVFAHPVHYIVESSDHDARNGIYQTIINALFIQKRVYSLRYAYVDCSPNSNWGVGLLEDLYNSCMWGTVVLRYTGESEDDEDEMSTAGMTDIEGICNVIKKYQNSVQTIICFPVGNADAKASFLREMGSMSFIEIRHDAATMENSIGYLKYLSKENHIRTDKKLFSVLSQDLSYNITELNSIFDNWYNEKIRTKVYPQYSQTMTAKTKIAKEETKGSAYAQLCNMVGLDEAKKIIDGILAYNKAKAIFADRGLRDDGQSRHMVFTGNPGTAKTSVARLFARIMKDNGLVANGQLVEVGRGDLVGKYVGWTAPTIKQKFKEAMGGVLFIDEAYSLVEMKNGSFGDEAINTIVQEMENHRNDVVVIFAGYPKEMEEFLDRNPGLRSRVAFHVNFPDYSVEDLVGISDVIAKQKGLKISSGAREKLGELFAIAREGNNFGNGRYVRNVIEKAKMAHAQRLVSMDIPKLTDDDIITILEDDIEIPEKKEKSVKAPLGFYCA